MYFVLMAFLYLIIIAVIVACFIFIAALACGATAVASFLRRGAPADKKRHATPVRAPVRQFRTHLQRRIGQSNQRARAVVGRPLRRILRLKPQGKILSLRQRASALDVSEELVPGQEGQEGVATLGERSRALTTTLRANARRLIRGLRD